MLRLKIMSEDHTELERFMRLLPAGLIVSVKPALHKPPRKSLNSPYLCRYVDLELPDHDQTRSRP